MKVDLVVQNALRRSTAWIGYDREYRGAPSHAYLLVSEDEAALEQLLLLLCARAYCEDACMHCKECRKVIDDNKPDVNCPNPKGEAISVEKARALVEDAMLGSYEGGKKIYVLRNVQAQSERTQNTLLKTLEEPNEGVMFLLTATDTRGILPTVLSRVKLLPLPPFDQAQLTDILRAKGVENPEVFAKAAMGNVTLAMTLASDEHYFVLVDEVVDLLADLRRSADIPRYLYRPLFAKDAIDKTLDVMSIAVKDILYVAGGIAETVIYRNKLSMYEQLAKEFPLRSLPAILDAINEAKQKVAAYCTAANVADDLLLTMLEVKKQCVS